MKKFNYYFAIILSLSFILTGTINQVNAQHRSNDSIILTNPSGTFDDGGYTDNVSRKWIIQPQNAVSVTLSFITFHTEEDFDFVRVYDGETVSAPLLGSFSGDDVPDDVTSTGGNMLVHFITDDGFSAGYGGFSASYSTSSTYCSGTTTLDSFSGDFSDGSSDNDYGNNSDCKWLIQPLGASTVNLTFNAFDVENTYDYLRVYDGSTTSAPLIGEYTGNVLPPDINSTGSELLVHFISNESVTAPGWEASYEGVSPSLSVSPSNLNIGPESGSSADFNISSNTDWAVSSDQTWLSVEPESGSDDGTVSVVAQENTSLSQRSATVTVSYALIEEKIVTVTQDGAVPVLDVSVDTITLSANPGNSDIFNVSSNVSWNVNAGESWLSVSPANDSANGVVTVIALSENTMAESRVTTVNVAGEGLLPEQIMVIQEGTEPSLSAYPSSLTLNSDVGSSSTFDITSNIDWEISSDQPWLIVSPSSGSNNNSITVLTTSENPSSSGRTATVTISGEDIADQSVFVTQQGTEPSLSVIPDTVIIQSAAESEGSFDIVSNTNWQVNSTSPWLTVSPDSGANNGIVTLTANTENTDLSSRIAEVVVSGTGLPNKTVVVKQQGISLSLQVSNENITLNSSANSNSNFYVYSNVNWNISTDQSWLSVDPVNGSDSSLITITALTENNSTGSRTATLTVTGTNVNPKTVLVNQQGTAPALSVSPQILTIGSTENGSANFNITSNVDGTVSDDQSWLDVSPASGTNNSTIMVAANSANASESSRTATIVVNSPTANSQIVTVIQEGTSPDLIVSPNNISLNPLEGSNISFDITSNLSWEISSNVNWLSLNMLDGTGNSTIEVTAQSTNDNSQARYGMLTISGGNISQTVIVVQEKITLQASTDSLYIASNSNSYDIFNLTSNVNWTISDNAGWLITEPTNGTGNDVITATATENNTSSNPRYATISVSSNYAEPVSVVVKQDANTGINEVFPVNSVSIYPNPVNKMIYIDIDEGLANGKIELLNLTGSVIASKEIKANNVFNLKKQPSGIYYIRIMSEGKMHTSKIVKQ
jgi:hypothetical protein